ncbi:beta-lactamase family protein [Rossellomorea vietnamensis]|uniref:Beta-lactamase family protein n=1 Tax=Rossellomorea vietnamensis TaxID=218284 RepID=A0A5D4NJ23_9BACI|nr:serine hydrolase domain-containing protein [Rossellomorea vietnamensis]TYS14047.1 beta-lactamase family protein [Rossellomorea vietnamensis]
MINFDSIDRIARSLLKDAPGLSVSIFNEKETLYQKGLGESRPGEKASPETLFRIGSVSKTLTAALIMVLVEKGELDLDTRVKDYIPELKLSHAEAEDITLRMLLSHTAGLPDGGDLFGYREAEGLSRYAEEILPGLEFVASPGLLYSYGNHAFNLAGFIAEKVCGLPFTQLMEKEVFNPLGMGSSTYDPLKAMTYPLALQYDRKEGGTFELLHSFPENSSCYPSFFCISNSTDMTKFGQMFLRGGELSDGNSLLSKDTISEMFSVQADRFTCPESYMGISWVQSIEQGVQFYWHSGGIGTYRSFLVLFPDTGLGVFIASNQDTGWEIVDEVVKQLSPDSESEQEVELAQSQHVASLKGNYVSAKKGLLHIEEVNGVPKIVINGIEYRAGVLNETTLAALDDMHEVKAAVGILHNNNYLMLNGAPCVKVKEPLIQIPESQWEGFEGAYTQGELTFSISKPDDQFLLIDDEGEYACTYLYESKFFSKDYGMIEFKDEELIIMDSWKFRKVR